MDLNGLAAVITSATLAIPILIKLWRDQKKLRSDYEVVWKGITARGFVEAQRVGHLLPGSGSVPYWQLSKEARKVYQAISKDLKALRKQLEEAGKAISDDSLAFAIEQRFQDWMVSHACPSLGLSQHGCLAIACVIARENGTTEE